METNEIMVNEEIMEVTEDAMANEISDLGKGCVIGAAIVAGSLMAYKYVIKPLAAKIKDAREQKKLNAEDTKLVLVDDCENDEE
jgi:flagellar motor component MotA